MGHYREQIKPAQSHVAPGLAKVLRYFWKKIWKYLRSG
jgi:hypothetical protein